MTVVAKPCPVGARVVDSLPFSQGGTAAQAVALKSAGIDGIALYLGVASRAVCDDALAAGLLVWGVTLAGRYDGLRAALHAKSLGLPAGTTLFLDVEGNDAWETPPAELITNINAWARSVSAAGYQPGIYVGAPQPLTTAELTALGTVRYWKGQGRCVDRTGALAEPRPGWCVYQTFPSRMWAGVWVDVNIVGQDFKTRVPMAASMQSSAAPTNRLD